MRYLLAGILVSITTLLPFIVQAEFAGSFSTAKKWAENDIYHDRRITFYCGCTYSEDKEVNQASCGYSPRKPFTRSGKENTRDNRVEWEHVLPASLMGRHLSCWGSDRDQFSQCKTSSGKLRSGRECCQRVNETFSNAHNDLVNLTPAIGEVNGDRSNHRYGIVEDEPRKYGECDFEFENNIAEPTEKIRGDIARIQLYMLTRYGEELGFTFSLERLQMLHEWAVVDPISEWELERNQRICNKQGSGNLLVSECQ